MDFCMQRAIELARSLGQWATIINPRESYFGEPVMALRKIAEAFSQNDPNVRLEAMRELAKLERLISNVSYFGEPKGFLKECAIEFGLVTT